MFAYHMRYRLVEIERAAGRKATRDRDGLAGIPNLISIVASDGTQYDFCGVDDDNLVRISLDDTLAEQRGAEKVAVPELLEALVNALYLIKRLSFELGFDHMLDPDGVRRFTVEIEAVAVRYGAKEVTRA